MAVFELPSCSLGVAHPEAKPLFSPEKDGLPSTPVIVTVMVTSRIPCFVPYAPVPSVSSTCWHVQAIWTCFME